MYSITYNISKTEIYVSISILIKLSQPDRCTVIIELELKETN